MRRSSSRTIYFLLTAIFIAASPSFGAELIEIRTGFHHSYSRIVLEFNTPVRYHSYKDYSTGAVILEIAPVRPLHTAIEVHTDPRDTYLQKVETDFFSSTLRVTALLRSLDARINIYQLDWPFRVVVDIGPQNPLAEKNVPVLPAVQQESTPSRADSLPESAPIEQEAVDQAVDSDATAVLSSPSTDSTAVLNLGSEIQYNNFADAGQLQQELSERESSPPVKSGKVSLLVKVIVGFALFDVILVGIHFVRRRIRSRKRQSVSKAQAKQHAEAIPVQQEFLDVLHQSLIEHANNRNAPLDPAREQPDSETIAAATKIDQMIQSLSHAMTFELNPLLRELDTLAMNSGLTKEQIIGKDGEAFLGNLKRLQAN